MVLIFILIYFEWRDTENQQFMVDSTSMHNFTFPLAARGSRKEGRPLAVCREVNKGIGHLRIACEQQTHLRSSLLSLRKIARRPEMSLPFAG